MKAIKRLFGLAPAAAAAPELRVLMVCSGNICRSPTAEGVLRARLERDGLAGRVEVDSAGIQGLHAKEPPDPRAQAHARRRGYDLSRLRARKIVPDDFHRFDRIYAMDEDHLGWLQEKAPADARAQVALLMTHAARHREQAEVPDPYYGSDRDFERVLDLVEDACDGLAQELGRQLGPVPRPPDPRAG